MISWIWFSLIAMCIWSFTSLIDKFVLSKGYIKSPFAFIALNGMMNVLLIFLLPFIKVTALSFYDFLILLVSGASLAAAVALYYRAVQYEEISRIAIMFQFSPILVLVISFFMLGEILTMNHFIGFILLLLAGVIVSYKKGNGKFKISEAFFYMMLSAVLGSISIVAARHIIKATDFWNAFFWLRASSLTALFVLFAPNVRREFAESFRKAGKNIRSLLGFKMLVDFSAFIFAGYALLNTPAVALMSALNSTVLPMLVFVLTLLTSLYLPGIIKEEISRNILLTKIIAIILIAAGITFINI